MVEHHYHGTGYHELDNRDSRWNTVVLRGELILPCLQTDSKGELILPSCSKKNNNINYLILKSLFLSIVDKSLNPSGTKSKY